MLIHKLQGYSVVIFVAKGHNVFEIKKLLKIFILPKDWHYFSYLSPS